MRPVTPPLLANGHQPAAALGYREVLSGPFAFGPTDPREGSATGRRTGWRIILWATVALDGSNGRRPERTGSLTGEIQLPGVGRRIPFTGGAFKLFPAWQRPDGRYERIFASYEAPFVHDGRPYRLIAHSDPTAGPGLLPSAIPGRPLRVQLYEGAARGNGARAGLSAAQAAQAASRVVGSGTIRFGPTGLVSLLTSLRALPPAGPLTAGRALGDLGLTVARGILAMRSPGRPVAAGDPADATVRLPAVERRGTRRRS